MYIEYSKDRGLSEAFLRFETREGPTQAMAAAAAAAAAEEEVQGASLSVLSGDDVLSGDEEMDRDNSRILRHAHYEKIREFSRSALSVLSGDEEEAYYEKIRDMRSSRNNKKNSGKGKDKGKHHRKRCHGGNNPSYIYPSA